jgi:hypothetical protein
LDEPIEPIKIAFCKTLEFMLDTLGCSLGDDLLKILTTVIHHSSEFIANNALQTQSKTDTNIHFSHSRIAFHQKLK